MGPAEHDGWQPTAEVLETSRVSDFCNVAGYGNFEDLLAASVEDPPSYWASAVDYLGLPFSRAFDMVVDESSGVAHPRWFVGGETNAAAMCLDRWLEADSESPAVDWHGEDGSRRGWTRRELSQAVEGLAAALRGRGIRLSDRVAILMPMVPEAVAAFLAIARIGAVAVPLFSGFGTDAIRVRLEDSSVSAILTMDRTLRGGRHLDVARNALAASAELETVHTIVVAARDGGSPEIEGDPRVILLVSQPDRQQFVGLERV